MKTFERTSESEIIREILQYLNRWRGKLFIFAVSPIGSSSVNLTDLALLGWDIKLLREAGINVSFALNSEEYQSALSGAGCDFFGVGNFTDTLAKALECGADKICLLCGADAIHTERGILDDLSLEEAKVLLESKPFSEDAKSTLKFAVTACESGIPRVHIFNVHQKRGVVLDELFTGKGAGVMVYNESTCYKQVRTAEIRDEPVILYLMNGKNESTHDLVHTHIAEYLVYAVDGEIYGCARVVKNQSALEIQDLAFAGRFSEEQMMHGFVKAVEVRARAEKIAKIAVSDVHPAIKLKPWFAPCFKKWITKDSAGREFWVKEVSK